MLVLVYMLCLVSVSMFFIVHGCMPSDLTDTVLVPIVKDKTGDISDKGNYRPIALASVISKCKLWYQSSGFKRFIYKSGSVIDGREKGWRS